MGNMRDSGGGADEVETASRLLLNKPANILFPFIENHRLAGYQSLPFHFRLHPYTLLDHQPSGIFCRSK